MLLKQDEPKWRGIIKFYIDGNNHLVQKKFQTKRLNVNWSASLTIKIKFLDVNHKVKFNIAYVNDMPHFIGLVSHVLPTDPVWSMCHIKIRKFE